MAQASNAGFQPLDTKHDNTVSPNVTVVGPQNSHGWRTTPDAWEFQQVAPALTIRKSPTMGGPAELAIGLQEGLTRSVVINAADNIADSLNIIVPEQGFKSPHVITLIGDPKLDRANLMTLKPDGSFDPTPSQEIPRNVIIKMVTPTASGTQLKI